MDQRKGKRCTKVSGECSVGVDAYNYTDVGYTSQFVPTCTNVGPEVSN